MRRFLAATSNAVLCDAEVPAPGDFAPVALGLLTLTAIDDARPGGDAAAEVVEVALSPRDIMELVAVLTEQYGRIQGIERRLRAGGIEPQAADMR